MALSETEYTTALDAFVKLTRANNTLDRRLMLHHPLPAGMTVSQFGVLEALLHKGQLTHHEVAERILKTPGNITSVVDHLEKQGLLARRRCERDRRRVFLELTPKGGTIARDTFMRMREAIRQEMCVLDPAELVELGRLCKKLGTAPRYGLPEEESR